MRARLTSWSSSSREAVATPRWENGPRGDSGLSTFTSTITNGLV